MGAVAGGRGAKFRWGVLVHLGMNEWHERGCEDAANIPDSYLSSDHVRFDEDVWKRVSERLRSAGANQIVIDLGEALIYPSHPEIAVKGGWSADKLRAELRRLRAMGLEPIPKLNFSTTHDLWMGDYHRMVSTPKYYSFVSDVIGDVCEIFETPQFFHIGMDEEEFHLQERRQSIIVIRKGELWWKDLLFYVREIEKRGVRAWCWSNCVRMFDAAVYAKRMPMSVVQSPWWYHGSLNPNGGDGWDYKPAKALYESAKLGFDTIPCSSNCYRDEQRGLQKLVELCDRLYPQNHLLGYLMAPWIEMNARVESRWNHAADSIAETVLPIK